jgi:hypothetical protein
MFTYRPVDLTCQLIVPLDVIIHKQVSYHLKLKFNPCQHRLMKSKSTTTNLVAYLDFITLQVHSQRQVDVIRVDFCSPFDLVPHALPLHELDYFGLCPA